mmetsp:Transcript_7475/g.19628  ORF Transcript_7475/g.19628 Transcript_7475/m.19628 type:complete len:244 (+) Transcript_7475:253-984(+)
MPARPGGGAIRERGREERLQRARSFCAWDQRPPRARCSSVHIPSNQLGKRQTCASVVDSNTLTLLLVQCASVRRRLDHMGFVEATLANGPYGSKILQQDLVLLCGRHVVDDRFAIQRERRKDPRIGRRPSDGEDGLLVIVERLDEAVSVGVVQLGLVGVDDGGRGRDRSCTPQLHLIVGARRQHELVVEAVVQRARYPVRVRLGGEKRRGRLTQIPVAQRVVVATREYDVRLVRIVVKGAHPL